MSTAIVEYTATEAALADLRVKYADVIFDVATSKGMTEAKAARAELRTLRVNLEAKRKEIKAPALKRCAEIDTEAKRITAELAEMEDPIDLSIKAEEDRKANAKAEAERIEREKVEARNRRFDAIKALPLRAVDATAEGIEAIIAEAQADTLSDIDAEYMSAAKYAMDLSVLSLKAALDKRRAADVEAARIVEERKELERLRAERADQQAEADRIAAEERERLAAEDRRRKEVARAEREAIEKAAREAREEEQRRIDAERAEQRKKEDAERAVEAERLRKEREQAEAERREKQRIEDEEREAAAEKLRQDQEAAAQERKRLDREKAAAMKAERERSIAEATLIGAAGEAVAFLKSIGHAENVVTLKLESALRREPAKGKKAA